MERQTKGSTGLADTLEMVPLLSVTFCMRKTMENLKRKSDHVEDSLSRLFQGVPGC
jgi:hypothetical protein